MRQASDRPVTLITGVSRGVGQFLVGHYLSQGHIVVGCSRTKTAFASEDFFHFEADVADESAAKEIFRFIRKTLGRLDHLINNAGVASMNHSLLTPTESVRRVLEVNVIGTFLFCREGAKVMRRRESGRIVNFSTVAVPLKLEGESVYAASKAAVETLTAILARELGESGITVNAVGPAPIETDLLRGVPKEKLEALMERQAVHAMASFEDVANVVDFFLSPASGMVTGQTIYLGGV